MTELRPPTAVSASDDGHHEAVVEGVGLPLRISGRALFDVQHGGAEFALERLRDRYVEERIELADFEADVEAVLRFEDDRSEW